MSEVVVTKGRIPLLEPPLEQRIRHGAWALVAVFVASSGVQLFTQNPPLTWWSLVDLPVVAALAYGVYRKSRVAAALILVIALPGYGRSKRRRNARQH